METETEPVVKEFNRSFSQSNASGKKQRPGRPRETEEEAIIRRFHDAQRMARFRARKRKALEDQQLQLRQLKQLEANGIVVCRSGSNDSDLDNRTETSRMEQLRPQHRLEVPTSPETESKYAQLLSIIERIGRDVRLSYAGSRSSAERLKSGIVRARGLVRDCLIETSLNLRQ